MYNKGPSCGTLMTEVFWKFRKYPYYGTNLHHVFDTLVYETQLPNGSIIGLLDAKFPKNFGLMGSTTGSCTLKAFSVS